MREPVKYFVQSSHGLPMCIIKVVTRLQLFIVNTKSDTRVVAEFYRIQH